MSVLKFVETAKTMDNISAMTEIFQPMMAALQLATLKTDLLAQQATQLMLQNAQRYVVTAST